MNVDAELVWRGIRRTGSTLEGRPSGPVAGAVAVFSRGGRGKSRLGRSSPIASGLSHIELPDSDIPDWRHARIAIAMVGLMVAVIGFPPG